VDVYSDNFPQGEPPDRLPQLSAMSRDHVSDGELVIRAGSISSLETITFELK
jgi:hypothetical protein